MPIWKKSFANYLFIRKLISFAVSLYTLPFIRKLISFAVPLYSQHSSPCEPLSSQPSSFP